MDSEKLANCQEAIGYTFANPSFLQGALTHSSAKTEARRSNERLEFLGDAILGMAISAYLYRRFPHYSEGELTKIKSVVVSQKTLASVSGQMGFRDFLVVGRGIADRNGMPKSMLANAFEAIVAAIYLDGALEAATEFVIGQLAPEIDNVQKNRHDPNYKSMLQQYSQQHLNATPVYRVLKEEGPDHVKMFHVMTFIEDTEFGSGWGKSKKQAEQRAAMESLNLLKARSAEAEDEQLGQSEDTDAQ